jgi:hypothetical protein
MLGLTLKIKYKSLFFDTGNSLRGKYVNGTRTSQGMSVGGFVQQCRRQQNRPTSL